MHWTSEVALAGAVYERLAILEQDDWPATAGMDISVQEIFFRALVFFSGQSELMGHVLSGTASDPISAYQGTTFSHNHEHYVILSSGATVLMQLLGAQSVDLNGSGMEMEMNLAFGIATQMQKLRKDKFIAWATFPSLPELTELDLSNCCIEHLTKEVFRNLSNLRRLFLGQNRLTTMPANTFFYVPFIQCLDLSSINRMDNIWNSFGSIQLPKTIFLHLLNLEYLDLSYTMLTFRSHKGLSFAKHLKCLSLCRTGLLMVGRAIFRNTSLVILDLSGNPYAPYHIRSDTFEGVSGTLQYLLFKNSNIKQLNWLQSLSYVRGLALAGNNINSASLNEFRKLVQLEVLDISSNHISNWYNRVFQHNNHLRVLNLRDNNINIFSTEMLRDFQQLEYLGIGENDFLCDCLLNPLVEIATINNRFAKCIRRTLKETHNLSSDIIKGLNISVDGDFLMRAIVRSIPALHPRYYYINDRWYQLNQSQLLSITNYLGAEKPSFSFSHCFQLIQEHAVHAKLNISELKFQLLDYEEANHWCFNETERLPFAQINCQGRSSYPTEEVSPWRRLNQYVLSITGSLIGLSLLCVFIYLKRWHIHYFYSSLKSAALVSVATKDAVDKFNELSKTDPNLVYDIFISYCQNDRQWVLQELLPNVETAGDISICMHERDFQIGLDILDNIISCMDRSKAFMLIISTNFLLSHWCQFEMHLAQHHMFEASKEHLILIFLEDIPRSKRPKTLQYFMDVKTYIKWPAAKANKLVKSEDKKLFWKRLRKSLENIGLKYNE